jgi:L-threonylcarbamoyladenylate synthase
MIISGNNPVHVQQAVDALCTGELLGLPTETVYGLAADACNESAVAKIFKAKGRPSNHPLIDVTILARSTHTHFAPTYRNGGSCSGRTKLCGFAVSFTSDGA